MIDDMVTVIIYISLVLVGLILGSFSGATVWRLRARQLRDDKKYHEKVDPKEYEQLKGLLEPKLLSDHSRCLHCGYRLKWYDLIPLVSWLSLGGKCRQCKKPIGYFEPLIELGVALFFVLSYAFWPYGLASTLEITQFVLWLVTGVGLAILFAYDLKWSLLPNKVTFIVIGLGLASAVISIIGSNDLYGALASAIWSVLILGGIYAVIYMISRGRWIGFGDVKLGIGLGLLLADWQLAFMALFFANFIGCLIVLPMMALHKLKPTSRVPFGPLLITGMIIAMLFGQYVLTWYLGLTF